MVRTSAPNTLFLLQVPPEIELALGHSGFVALTPTLTLSRVTTNPPASDLGGILQLDAVVAAGLRF